MTVERFDSIKNVHKNRRTELYQLLPDMLHFIEVILISYVNSCLTLDGQM